MNVVLKKNTVPSASWYPLYVRKTVYNALSKFSVNITKVSIYLSAKKDNAKRCLMVINTQFGERIVTRCTQSNLSLALQNAIAKARTALKSMIEKSAKTHLLEKK